MTFATLILVALATLVFRGWSIRGRNSGFGSQIEVHPLVIPSIPLTVAAIAALLWYFDGLRVYATSHIDAVVEAHVAQMWQDERKTRLEGDRIEVENCMGLAKLDTKTATKPECLSKIGKF